MFLFYVAGITVLMYYVGFKNRNQIKATRQNVLECVKIIIQYFQCDYGF
jgi:hypothetical protein